MQYSLPVRVLEGKQIALPAQFALFGFAMSTWASRIPALREGVSLSHSSLSLVLLCGGLGAVLSYPLSSRLIAALGTSKALLVAALGLMLDLIGIGLASSLPLLMLAVLLLGVTASCFDVAVNSLATQRERETGKSGLAKLHAVGCAGSLAGALFGSLVAGLPIPPAAHFSMVAIPMAILFWISHTFLSGKEVPQRIEKKTLSLPKGPLVLLGALGFLGAMSEGSIVDWSGVFMKDHFGVTDGFAPLALSAFTVLMLIARLAGDTLKEKYGASRLVSSGAAISAAGLTSAVFVSSPYSALAGFALAGLGLALVFPFVFSAAGKKGPVALAGVATMAYSGSLMGPPVLGGIAHLLGMQAAMGFVALLSAMIAIVATRASMLE